MLAVGVGAQGSFSAMFSGIPVTGVSMREGYHLSTGALGLALACLGLGVAVSDIVWGLLTDRFGDRRVLLTGLTSTGVLLVVMATAVTPADGAGTVLLAVCLTIAGALGGSVNGASGRAVMTTTTGLSAPVAESAVRTPRVTESAARTSPAAESAVPASPVAEDLGLRSPLRRWDVWRLALAGALLTVPQFAVLTFTAIFLHDAKGAGTALAGLTVLIAQLGGGAVRIWTGRRTDRAEDSASARRACLRRIGVLAGIVLAGAAVLTDAPTPITVTALALGGLLANSWHGVAYTEIAAMAGAGRAGTALGLIGTTLFAMAFLTPLLIPVVLAHTSWATVWGLAAAASLAAVPLAPAAFSARRSRRAR